MTAEPNQSPYRALEAYDPEEGALNVVIETPKGRRNKYKFDEKLGLFTLSGVLTAGAVFPFDFGYIPATQGGDGDPLDVLILMDEPAFTGCLVQARLIGVIEAEQTEDGKTERNDRLIAVAVESHDHKKVKNLDDLGETRLREIEHFFVSYNQIKNKEFKPTGRKGAGQAEELVKEGQRRVKKQEPGKGK